MPTELSITRAITELALLHWSVITAIIAYMYEYISSLIQSSLSIDYPATMLLLLLLLLMVQTFRARKVL